ncbi:CapA family protein [Lacisediminimonas profundi]|uniref:CapA family protein n=1 Tax=Lacisediminimonas profundi TaxID=2603856 RepID=UPI001386732F|nr:CapA family protein [Lacisediminimonas profundi]
MRVIFGGDVMLGRGVGAVIRREGTTWPLGEIAGWMRSADLCIVNLECAITASKREWEGEPKVFYFGAPPESVHALVDAGVDLVSLSNNHTLDFGVTGLNDTLRYLDRHGIRHCGAGPNLASALAPANVEAAGIRFGMTAFCDHQSDFAAQAKRPGIAWLDLDDEAGAIAAFAGALAMQQQRGVDWPILSLHWGPNMVWAPSQQFRRLAHAAIDMGWKILFGHSAHIFHGIEIYSGCPILYAAGDLVDDYWVDPVFLNDHQLLFELSLTRSSLQQVRVLPVFIEDCQARPATPAQARTIWRRMERACAELGSKLQVSKDQSEAMLARPQDAGG